MTARIGSLTEPTRVAEQGNGVKLSAVTASIIFIKWLNNNHKYVWRQRLWVLSGGSGRLGEAYIYTPFAQQVLHITKRKRKSNIHHYCKSDDFRAGFKVAKWGVFCHWPRLQISPARFKQVYSDKAGIYTKVPGQSTKISFAKAVVCDQA